MIRGYTDRTIETLDPYAQGAIYMPEGGLFRRCMQ